MCFLGELKGCSSTPEKSFCFVFPFFLKSVENCLFKIILGNPTEASVFLSSGLELEDHMLPSIFWAPISVKLKFRGLTYLCCMLNAGHRCNQIKGVDPALRPTAGGGGGARGPSCYGKQCTTLAAQWRPLGSFEKHRCMGHTAEALI